MGQFLAISGKTASLLGRYSVQGGLTLRHVGTISRRRERREIQRYR